MLPRVLVALLTLFAITPGAARAANIGVTSAVLPQATGTPPDEDARVLRIGNDVFADERVVTGSEGKAQLLFLDGTALSIGPNAELVLDELVYDPDAKVGRIAMSATRGVFRLVGGRISKQTPITLKTPTATIGIRGGIVLVAVTTERVIADFLFGDELTITTPNGTVQSVGRAGTAVMVEAGGAVEFTQSTGDDLSQRLDQLEGQPQQRTEDVPSVADTDLAGTQISSLSSAAPPQTSQPGAAGRTETAATASAPVTTEPVGVREATRNASQQQPIDQLPPITETPSGDTPDMDDDVPPVSDDVPPVSDDVPPVDDDVPMDDTPPDDDMPPPPSLAGRYYSQVPFLANSFDFDTLFVTADPSREIGFSSGMIENGSFVASLNGQPVRLPADRTGRFNFVATGTDSPFGPVAGRAFIARRHELPLL